MPNALDNLLAVPGFKEKLAQVCKELGCKPADMLKVMASESGFNPAARNTRYPESDASGLIQITKTTAQGLGVTTEQIRAMSAVQQLDLVYKYFSPYKGKLNSAGALYAVTFLPARFGRPMTEDMLAPDSPPLPTNSPVLASKYDRTTRGRNRSNTDYYTQNVVLDKNNDGFITVADLDKQTEEKARQFNITDSILSDVRPSTTPLTTLPTQQTSPDKVSSDYIESVYKAPFKTDRKLNVDVLVGPSEANTFFKDYLNKLRGPDYTSNTIDVPYGNVLALQPSMLDNDIFLINSIVKKQQKQQQEIKSILVDKLGSFSPSAKMQLLSHGIFEVYPDDMRNKMSQNSTMGGANPNYSHAWRLPNKLSVTADLVVPGISGLRVGQVFWVDKLGDAYKQFGAFQLFGLTENIDISRGWTTSIHSRFIALPRKGSDRYLTDEVKSGNTAQDSKEGKSQN